MAEYRLGPAAQRDLDEIFDYTTMQWSVSQAVRYTDLVEAACAEMAESPHRAQDCSTIRPGYRRRVVKQHAIYFPPTADGIAVIRILHRRMDSLRHL